MTPEMPEFSEDPQTVAEEPQTDLQRIEGKLDMLGQQMNYIVQTVANAERAILAGPMGKMIAGRAASGNRA